MNTFPFLIRITDVLFFQTLPSILIHESSIRNIIILTLQMSTVNNKILVLVYYKVRGKLQPIRNLLLYLELPFVQIHWGNEEQKKSLPEQAINCLKGIRIEKSALPLLVFQGLFIYDMYPIMAYLCRRFSREDLLGNNIRQRTRLQEILEIFFVRQPNSMSQLFKLAEFCVNKNEDEIMREKVIYIQKFFNESGYLKEICLYLEQQDRPEAYILQTVTILDFLFLESCHYMLGMFNNIDQKKCSLPNIFRGLLTCGSEVKLPDEVKYLTIMRNFLNFMYKHQFYANNRKYLQSFSVICSTFTPERVQGLKKIWCYNPRFVL